MKESYIKYLVSLLLFGLNGIVASRINLSSYEIVLFRTLLGSIILIVLFLLTKQKFTFYKHKKDLLYICISGVAMGASWMFLYEGYVQIGVSVSTLLYYCGPVIVMVLSQLLFREKLTAVKVVGFIAVFFGVILVNGKVSGSSENIFGVFCGLMSAVTYSVMVIANKKAKNIVGMENPVIQLVVSFITVAIFVGVKDGFNFEITSNDWIWILILGFLNTGIGCYLYFSSISKLPVQTLAVCGYLELVSAVVFSMVFLKEAMQPLQIAGAILIVGGALFAELFKKKKHLLYNK